MDTATTEKRLLYCACCGGHAGRWQQFHNRDTGYGICAKCVDWIRQRNVTRPFDPTDIERTYGVEGVNWGRTSED